MSDQEKRTLTIPNLHLEILHLSKIPQHIEENIEDMQTLDSNNQLNSQVVNIKSYLTFQNRKKTKSVHFQMEEKEKKKSPVRKKIQSDNLLIKKRYDVYGNQITKMFKKQRVSFADSISRRGRLTEVIKIQSLKNVLEFYDDVGHKENKVKTTCCCILF